MLKAVQTELMTHTAATPAHWECGRCGLAGGGGQGGGAKWARGRKPNKDLRLPGAGAVLLVRGEVLLGESLPRPAAQRKLISWFQGTCFNLKGKIG